jgi:AcrR family transcriptional regulator
MKNSRKSIQEAFEELSAKETKLTISAVAKKAGVSPALIHNRHPDLKQLIDAEIAHRKNVSEEIARHSEIQQLKKKNESLKSQLKKAKKNNSDESVKILLGHITELYSMNDQLLKENDALRKKLKSSETTPTQTNNIDKSTSSPV